MSNTITILHIATIIARNLGIEVNTILNSIPPILLNEEVKNHDLLVKIHELIVSDQSIDEFGKSHQLGENFNILKNNLGKLQLLVLLKNLKKAEKCDDVLNHFLNIMNNKIVQVNDILNTNLQFGGSKKNYYKKYNKYKKKYCLLKKMYDIIY